MGSKESGQKIGVKKSNNNEAISLPGNNTIAQEIVALLKPVIDFTDFFPKEE